jgi:hypothetical protein
MAKFANRDIDDEPTPPAEREIVRKPRMVPPPIETVSIASPLPPPAPPPQVVVGVVTPPPAAPVPPPAANNAASVAQVALDTQIFEQQVKKEEEHWMKSYWRPAMGWLYMIICFVDFVVFPVIAMFMPIILKGVGIQMQYVAWQSLTLSNGGLIHLAFGAILGVTSYTRGQEKIAGK